ALSSLGIGAYRDWDLKRARELFEQSLEIQERLGWWRAAGFQETCLGRIARAEGDYTTARRYYTLGLPRFCAAGDRPNIAGSLEEGAGLAVALGQPQRAARLFGAAAALRERISQPQEPYRRADYKCDVAEVRAGMEQTAFAAAWAAGHNLTLDGAVAEVLVEQVETPEARPPIPRDKPTDRRGFSRREIEVLRLLAGGAANAAIGKELGISVRTVDGHVARILARTGCANRTAVAMFARDNGLLRL